MTNGDWWREQQALKQTTEMLKKNDFVSGFELNEDYFDSLHDKIMTKIELMPESKGTWFGWRKQKLWRAFTNIYSVKKT